MPRGQPLLCQEDTHQEGDVLPEITLMPRGQPLLCQEDTVSPRGDVFPEVTLIPSKRVIVSVKRTLYHKEGGVLP